jgi:hypothetical protein
MLVRDFRQFNPEYCANLEANLWIAYYNHRFLRLFMLLFKLNYIFFQPRKWLTLWGAYHTTRSAVIFRLTKGHEDRQKTLKHLISYFKLLSDHSIKPFDYQRVAELELEWWMIDRYPDRYKTTRSAAITASMAAMVQLSSARIQEYGENRAAAMELLGKYHEDTSTKVDWRLLHDYLRIAYQALHAAIQ